MSKINFSPFFLFFLLLNLFFLPSKLSAQSQWYKLANPMNYGRYLHTATLLTNGMVLVAGGIGGSASAELYNPTTGTWSITGSMNFSRYTHTATLLTNGMVLVAGGIGGAGSAELYDPATGTWSLTGSMKNGRYNHTATLLNNGMVIIVGGPNVINPELYNPATGTWKSAGLMTVNNRERAAATLLNDGNLLVTGGGVSGGGIRNSSELYNATTGTWSLTGSMQYEREAHTTTLLTNGMVLAAGGFASYEVPNSAELYNPETGTWALTGFLNIAIDFTSCRATLLKSGLVLLITGQAAGSELFYSPSETWIANNPKNFNSFWFTSTLLPNGEILTTGGDYNDLSPYKSATTEIFGIPPIVISQPFNTTNYTGDDVSLNISIISGTTENYYNWFFLGTNLNTGYNSFLTISNCDLNYFGSYYVVVTNLSGSVTSSMAAIIKNDSPLIYLDGKMSYGGFFSKINYTVVTMSSTSQGGLIYYTLDSSNPTTSSKLYTGPFIVTNSCSINSLGLNVNTLKTSQAPTLMVEIVPVNFAASALTAGGGSVAISPSHLVYWSNSVITVTANASNGWKFLNWSGDATGTNNPLNFTINANATNIQAVFGTTLSTSIKGSGTVQQNIANPIPYGTSVQVTAIPNPGSGFSQWGDALISTTNPATFCVITTNPVTAKFTNSVYQISAITLGGGNVFVSQTQAYYQQITTITGVANNGWTFLNWIGDAETTNNPLYLSITNSVNLKAVFCTFLNVSNIGNGSIQLNASNQITYGTIVQAAATPKNGSFFIRWLSQNGNTNNPEYFTITNANQNITGVFTLPLIASTKGGGNVQINPVQLNYPASSVVSATATASNGWTFLYWTGDVTSTNNPLNITMDTEKSISAVFGIVVGAFLNQ